VASVFAVHELLKEGLLDVNVIFLIEGEEESGSNGFLEAITSYQVNKLFAMRNYSLNKLYS
jgi:di- and tripeptidase